MTIQPQPKNLPLRKKSLFQRLEEERQKAGLTSRTQTARHWLMGKVKSLSDRVRPGRVINDGTRYRAFQQGRMYFFYYNPKGKNDLPYYDTFPLVIPIDFYPDGFLGINFHYLDPMHRARLLDRLEDFRNNSRYDETTKLKLEYELLKASKRHKLFKPCLKKYLFGHVKSKFIRIESNEWEIAVFLPFDRFKKEPAQVVWDESLGKRKVTKTGNNNGI